MKPNDLFDMFRRKGGARCVEVGRLIQTYLDGKLDADTTAKVARHLKACRRCGLATDDYRRLKAALKRTGAPLPAEPLQRLRTFAADLASNDTSRE